MVPSILKLVWGRMVPSDLQMYNDGAWFQAYQKLAWGSMVPNVFLCIMNYDGICNASLQTA